MKRTFKLEPAASAPTPATSWAEHEVLALFGQLSHGGSRRINAVRRTGTALRGPATSRHAERLAATGQLRREHSPHYPPQTSTHPISFAA